MNMTKKLSLILMLSGAGFLMSGLWIPVKAELAQYLLHHAWDETKSTGYPVKPWPWADHYPVAQLSMAQYGISQIVLAGDEGHVLAFAPGENIKAKQEGSTRIISAHRDTHFRFLEKVEVGNVISLEDINKVEQYQIQQLLVVDADEYLVSPNEAENQLLLVTCYPFDAITAGGSLRFVVVAQKIEESSYEA